MASACFQWIWLGETWSRSVCRICVPFLKPPSENTQVKPQKTIHKSRTPSWTKTQSLYFFTTASNLVVFTNTLFKTRRLYPSWSTTASPVVVATRRNPWFDVFRVRGSCGAIGHGMESPLEVGSFVGKKHGQVCPGWFLCFFFWGGGGKLELVVVSNSLYVHPENWKKWSNWRAYFSMGLVETTN